MAITTIVFDFDGVLVESVNIKTEAFKVFFQNESPKVREAIMNYHLDHIGESRLIKIRHIYKEILKRPLSDTEFTDACRKFSDLVMEKVVNAPYVEGADQFLRNFCNRFDLFVASAVPQEEIREIVKKRKMAIFFKEVYGSPETKIDILRKLINEDRVKPAHSLFVGDAMVDYKAASDNKLSFVARVNDDNWRMFERVDCVKIRALSELEQAVIALGKKESACL